MLPTPYWIPKQRGRHFSEGKPWKVTCCNPYFWKLAYFSKFNLDPFFTFEYPRQKKYIKVIEIASTLINLLCLWIKKFLFQVNEIWIMELYHFWGWSQKCIIICATRTGEKLDVLAVKINALRQKLFIICATRAGANLGVLACKISVLRQKLFIICATRAGGN